MVPISKSSKKTKKNISGDFIYSLPPSHFPVSLKSGFDVPLGTVLINFVK